jgi:hypothetical protein
VEQLEEKLQHGFDIEVLRELNIVVHKLLVVNNQLSAKFINPRARFENVITEIKE